MPAGKLGFGSESKLKSEPAGKSYFFLTNDVQWPEKKELPAPTKPVPPVKPPSVRSEPEGEEKHPITADTGVKTAVQNKSNRTPEKQANGATKKTKLGKKSGVPMPDIEQILADVRRSAQPKLPSEPAPALPASARSAEPQPSPNEIEVSVDMDELARDLAMLQKSGDQGSTAAARKETAASQESKSQQADWWKICALVTGAAAAGFGLYYGACAAIRRRKHHSRSQAQIDSETRVFFDKLLSEQRRRASRPAAPVPPRHAAAPPVEEVPVEIPEPEPEPRTGPDVFLLPPELAEGAYKEAVTLAAKGESARQISEKLNLGEGEVRLVLDIARLTRERLQMA